MSEYSQSYIDKFMYRWKAIRTSVNGCAISIIPFAFLDLLNSLLWKSALVTLIAQCGMLGFFFCVITFLVIFFYYDIKKTKVDWFIRMREIDRIFDEDMDRLERRLDRSLDRSIQLNPKSQWKHNPNRNHFSENEDIFTI